ncbi:unnamed protein product, partial [Pleuronectes platessa]
LTMTGIGMGITSGVNSAVTTFTEIGVNTTQQNKAREVFQKFMEDVQSLQECLDKVTSQADTKMEESIIPVAVGVGKGLGKVGAIGRRIDALVDAASAAKLLKNEDLIAGVAKGPLGVAKSARAGFIALNALFLGMDIFFVCKDGHSLAKGIETACSQWIRARAALWSSEMDSWKEINDSLLPQCVRVDHDHDCASLQRPEVASAPAGSLPPYIPPPTTAHPPDSTSEQQTTEADRREGQRLKERECLEERGGAAQADWRRGARRERWKLLR